jgi:hypothetical protein
LIRKKSAINNEKNERNMTQAAENKIEKPLPMDHHADNKQAGVGRTP